MVENQRRRNRPGVVDHHVESGNPVVGIHRREFVAVVVVLDDVIGKVVYVRINKLPVGDALIEAQIDAVVGVGAGRV